MADRDQQDDSKQPDRFDDVDSIVAEPLKFKVKLAIGEDAYTSLKVKNAVVEAWDVAGVATTAAVVAKSSVVASTFFAPTGLLAAFGLGTAVTPIGWVVAAGVVSGGAWFGITRHFKKASASKVTVVPNFINTPLDVLALGLFDLMVPLALRVAAADGQVADSERQRISDYLVREWGYDADFVEAGLQYLEVGLDQLSVRQLAQTMADFASQNRDCNFRAMSREMLEFLRDIAAQNGKVDRGDERAIREIEAVFMAANRKSLPAKLRSGWDIVRTKTLGRLFKRKSQRR